MIQARLTEGVKPVTAANRNSVGNARSAESNRFRKDTMDSSVNKMDTCNPDTATICRIPLTVKSVTVS